MFRTLQSALQFPVLLLLLQMSGFAEIFEALHILLHSFEVTHTSVSDRTLPRFTKSGPLPTGELQLCTLVKSCGCAAIAASNSAEACRRRRRVAFILHKKCQAHAAPQQTPKNPFASHSCLG